MSLCNAFVDPDCLQNTAAPTMKRGQMNRRQFLQVGSAAASGLLLLKPSTAFGYQANSAVRLGLLGCGSRGTAVSTSFSQNTTAQVVALADLFPDQLAAGRSHFDQLNATLGRQPISSKLLFHGPRAFEQLAASPDIDLIQISTPPFLHVQHPSVAANYNAPASKEKFLQGASADELRLRNWLWDRALSGDILVEQNIHIIDLCNWMLNAHPVKASTHGGRDVLIDAVRHRRPLRGGLAPLRLGGISDRSLLGTD